MLKVMVTCNHLQKGMYVSELDRPWLDSPFIFQGFRITNVDEIIQLQETCEYVFIDKEKSLVDIPQYALLYASSRANKRSISHVHQTIDSVTYQTTFEEELPNAWDVYKQSLTSVNEILSDIRVGENLKGEAVKSTVNILAESIIRNPNALSLLCSLKDKGNFAVTHAINVCAMSLIYGRFAQLEESKLIELGTGALLHDIGETMIPTDILLKASGRTPAESKVMNSHVQYGAEILSNTAGIPASAILIAQNHHERENGTGYPNNIDSEQISYFTKIVSVIDIYDTVTSGLYGKPVINPSKALKHIYDWRGEMFDPAVVEKFIQCLGIYPIGSVVEFHSGEMGIVLSAEPKTRLYPKLLLVRDKDKQPMLPPKLIDLAFIYHKGNRDLYKIKSVVNPETYGIDVKKYVWRDLDMTLDTKVA